MYLALYRKWRPLTFADVISQEHITVTLQNQVRSGKTAHAYLFTGSRGTGKTTCSKILAKAVNCLSPVDGNPCLTCEICKGIEDGSILDVTEMDAASNNGVDDIRDLRDEANYAPSRCRFRVYIIDEVHMLSTSAFNALLKIMEEPPPHVLFILATTEIHKVPQTILSRCQQYDFRRIRPADSAVRLLSVCEQEGIALTSDAAALIARISDGGMRDALSLLDQCIAYSSEVTSEVVTIAAGIAGSGHMFSLSDGILAQNPAECLSILSELYDNAKGVERLTSELTGHFRNLMICKSVQAPESLIVCPPDELTRMMQQAENVPLSRILEILTILQKTLDHLARSTNKKVELEMTLIRLCSGTTAPPTAAAHPTQSADISLLQARIDQLENLLREAPPRASPKPERTRVVRAADSDAVPQPDNLTPLPAWSELLEELSQREPALFAILEQSTASVGGNVVVIESPNTMLKSLLLTDNIGAKLADEVERKLGGRYRLRIAKKERRDAVEASPALEDIIQKAAMQEIEMNVKE